jgi:hypothetical protein
MSLLATLTIPSAGELAQDYRKPTLSDVRNWVKNIPQGYHSKKITGFS